MTTTPITCPSCKTLLTEYKRFCPECGARIPEPDAAATMALPAAEVPAPGENTPPPSTVPPTVRLDTPAAATVLLPPEQPAAPPPPAADAPTIMAGPPPVLPPVLPRYNEPPATPPQPAAPSYGAPTPPANQGFGQLPTAEPVYGGQLPPADPAFGGQLPPASAAPPPTQRRTLWWIIGGAGCLTLVLLGVCMIGVLTLLGRNVPATGDVDVTPVTGAGGIVPNDTPLTGGTVLLEDDFESATASGLGVDEDESSRYAYEDGAYVIEVKEPETIVWARVDGDYDDARVTVETEVPPGADVSAAGLIFHYQDADNFYLFSVSNDGYYALELLQDNEWVTLIDWTESPAVDAVRNTMRVETQGDAIALYVNDELLEETSDGTFVDGEVALALSSLQDSTALVRFDNLLIETNE